MNQSAIGNFITQKRKEKNLTQAQLAVSQTFGGSDVKDFLSGTLLRISIGEMLAGVYVTARYYFSLNNAKVNP